MEPGDELTAMEDTARPARGRVLLLVPARTYRAADFLTAAARLGLDLVIGRRRRAAAGRPPRRARRPRRPAPQRPPARGRGRARRRRRRRGYPMLALAAAVAARLGLAHNPVEAVIAATDKTQQRRRWADAGIAQPAFRIVPAAASPDSLRQAAARVGYPCVVKAVSLSASQGILRAGDPAAAVAAAARIRQILAAAGRPGTEPRPRRCFFWSSFTGMTAWIPRLRR